MTILRFAPTLDGFAAAAATLHQWLERRRLAADRMVAVEVVFEEVVVNIVRHAAARGTIKVALTLADVHAVLTFEDDGVAFDPVAVPVPPLATSLDEAQIGGLGVLMVKQLSSRVEYERTPSQRNRLRVAVPIG